MRENVGKSITKLILCIVGHLPFNRTWWVQTMHLSQQVFVALTNHMHQPVRLISFTNKAACLEERKEIVFQLVQANSIDIFCWDMQIYSPKIPSSSNLAACILHFLAFLAFSFKSLRYLLSFPLETPNCWHVALNNNCAITCVLQMNAAVC